MKLMNVDEWDGSGTLPTLYSKTATGAVNIWQCWVEGGGVVAVRWGQLQGAQQEARFQCLSKNVGRSNETTAHDQAVKEAIAKWKKQIKKKYSEKLETAGETERIQPMLAAEFGKHKQKLVYPVTVQPKFDGLRCLAYRTPDGDIMLQSRGGDPYELPHIKDELSGWMSEGTVLDGELYIHGMSLQNINKLVRKPRDESLGLYYCIYDVLDLDDTAKPWSKRMEWLYGAFRSVGQVHRLWPVPNVTAYDESGVLELQKAFVSEGYEGAIVRAHEGQYRVGYRSPHLLKVKSWTDSEFPIIGYTNGKGKFENAAIFKCITPEGKTFEVTPMGTAEERLQMLRDAPGLVGKLLKVKYLGFTDEGAPTCARGICIREACDM